MQIESKRIALFIGVAAVALMMVSMRGRPSTNPNSRYATVRALVHEGSYAIERSPFRTIDKIKVGRHHYSSKPPMLSTLAAGAYWLANVTTGLVLHPDDDISLKFVALVFGVVPQTCSLWVFWLFTGALGLRDSTRLLALVLAAFGSLATGYASDFNNHAPASAAIFAAFYLAYRIKSTESRQVWVWLTCGLLAGLAATIDLGSLVVAAALLIYLVASLSRRWLWIGAFCAGGLVPVAIHLVLNYHITDSLLPAYLQKHLYDFPGSYFSHPRSSDALDEPKLIYARNVLMGPKGLLTITPLFLLAGAELIRRCRNANPLRSEALVVGFSTLIILVTYIVVSHNYGGGAVGFRWMIVLHPCLFLFVALFLERFSWAPWRTVGVAVLAGLSIFNALDALDNCWGRSKFHWAWNTVFNPWMYVPPEPHVEMFESRVEVVDGEATVRCATAKRGRKKRTCPSPYHQAAASLGTRVVRGRYAACLMLIPPSSGRGRLRLDLPKELDGEISVALPDHVVSKGLRATVRIVAEDGATHEVELTPETPSASVPAIVGGKMEVESPAARGVGACVNLGGGGW